MTPEMVKRVEFLREKAAEGYGSRWMAGELGISVNYVGTLCREHGIKLPNLRGPLIHQALARRGHTHAPGSFGHTEDINDCEDFLPDVGEV